MPGMLDLVLAALIAIAYPAFDYFVSWPRMRRGILAGGPAPRVAAYAEIIATLWGASIALAVMIAARRLPWSAFGLAPPAGWRLAVAVALVSALGWLVFAQLRALARLSPESRRRARAGLGTLELIVPHVPRERAWFLAVSLSAGVCEEFVYRGYLVWALRPWLGLWGAAAASVAGFACAHAYQGRRNIPKVAIVGALLGMVAIVTRSVLPGMVLHALIDVMGGEVAYAVAREEPGEVHAPAV